MLMTTIWLFLQIVNCCGQRYILAEAENFYDSSSDSAIYFMQEDRFHEGFILMSMSGLLFTTDGSVIHVIVGSPTGTGYKEGIGDQARFSGLRCFSQTSVTQVVTGEFNNHCLRIVDRSSNSTTIFAGRCETAGYKDSYNNDALFNQIYGMLLDQLTLFVVDHGNRAIRKVDLPSGTVATVVKEETSLEYPHYILKGVDNTMLLTNYRQGLVRIGPDPDSITALTGKGAGFADGPVKNALFSDARTLVWLDKSSVLVADTENNRLRTIDLESGSVYSLCKRTGEQSAAVDCTFPEVWPLLIVRDILYYGQKGLVQKAAIIHSKRTEESDYKTTPAAEQDKSTGLASLKLVVGVSISAGTVAVLAVAALIAVMFKRRTVESKRQSRASEFKSYTQQDDQIYEDISEFQEPTRTDQGVQTAPISPVPLPFHANRQNAETESSASSEEQELYDHPEDLPSVCWRHVNTDIQMSLPLPREHMGDYVVNPSSEYIDGREYQDYNHTNS